MKTTGLMIDDFVQLKDEYYGIPKGTIMQVVEVFSESAYCIDINIEFEALEVPDYLFEPIHLTPEILEKNFPDTEDGVLWWKDVDGMHIETETDGDMLFCGLFNYVHQFQHALRLCGIEKEIML